MPKDKKPRRRSKPAASQIEQPESESQPVVEPSGELRAAARPEALVRSRPTTPAPQIVVRLGEVIRTVAVALIDIADAAAESLESLAKRAERRT